MSRTDLRTLKIKLLAAGIALLAGCLAAPVAAAQTTPLTSFTLFSGAANNIVFSGYSTTGSATLVGTNTNAPSGSVDFFQGSNGSCSINSVDFGTSPVTTNTTAQPQTGQASFFTPNLVPGTYTFCATYIPDTSSIFAGQTVSTTVTVYQPVTVVVQQPAPVIQGTASTIPVVLSVPQGQPIPSGSVSLYDGNSGTTIDTVQVNSNGTVPNLSGTLTGTLYDVIYSGDSNYGPQTYSGTAYFLSPLVSVSPAAIQAGSPQTTLSVHGNGFTSASTVQITYNSGVTQSLATTFVSTTQLTAVVPATVLAVSGLDVVQVITGTSTSNSVDLDVYAQQATTSTVAASTPTSIPYGQISAATFGATVAPSAATETGLPSGSASFTLTGPGAVTTQLALGTATLTASAGSASLVAGTIDTSLDAPAARAISADLNGDGYADVVSLGGLSPNETYPNYAQVFLSNGANSFQSEQTVYTGCNTIDFAVGDINGDGKPDIIALCNYNGSGPIATYVLGNGDGTFQPPVTLISSTPLQYTTDIALGDFNGDGAMDVAVIDGVDDEVQVFTGSKTFGTFTALSPFSFASLTAGAFGITPAVAADFNQDGKSDIAFFTQPYQGQTPAVLILLTSNGDGTFSMQSQSVSTTAYSFPTAPAVTDVNGDGYPDVVIADPGLSSTADTGQIVVFENDGKGSLNSALTYAVTNPQSVAASPFPVIGKPTASAVSQPANIFFTTFDTTTGTINVTGLNLSGTTFTPVYPAQNAGYDISSYGGNNILVAGDFNGNGYDDAAVFANQSSSALAPTLFPYFYTNSSAATLSGVTQQPDAGTYNLTASYPGSNTFAASTSANFPVTITPATPAGSLIVSATSATYGQSVTYTTTVTGVPGGTIPSGNVTFSFADSSGNVYASSVATLIPGTNSATATYTLNTLNTLYPSTNPYTVTAVYNGDNNYSSSAIGSSSLTVNEITLSLSLTSSATTTTAGTLVTFTINATSSNGTVPTGEYVSFGGLPTSAALPTLDANGQAVYRFGLFSPGTYTITANYLSDGIYSAATSNTVTLTVNPTPVQVSVTSSANPVTYPTPVSFTATASSNGLGIPTGTINFANNGTAIGSGTLSLTNGASGLNQTASFDSSTTSNVVGEATGDFNHDGKADVAVLESTGTTSTLLVSLGNGDGTFQTPVSYSIPTNVTGIVAADFNKDGYSDLAVTDSAGNLYIYLASSTGSGALTLTQTLVGPTSNGFTPSDIAVASGDFNKDGSPDLAVLTSSYVLVYLNNGSGDFSTTLPATYASNAGNQYLQYTGMTVADFNKDGYPDIAVSTAYLSDIPGLGNNSVTLLTNNGAASPGFTTTTVPVAGGATNITSGDFNGDGYPDLAVLSSGDSTVDVLINQQGTFSSNTQYGTVGEPVGMTTADFNKDGYDDLVISGVAGGAGGGTMILNGSANGVFNTSGLLPTAYGFSNVSADLNGDGNPDLLVGDTQVTSFLDSAEQATLSNVVLPAGSNPITATYTPDSASTNVFASGSSAAYNQTVNQATPIVTWAAPASIVYGTPLSSTQLNATASVPGTFTYTPAAGTVLTGGTHALTVLFQPTSSNYAPVTASVNITVTQATPTVTWGTPAPIYYGIPLSSTQLNATASVPGGFTYTPPAGTVLAIGQHTLSVLFTPTDSVDYSTATATVTIVVQPGSILSAVQPSSANLGDPATTITLSGAGFLPTSVAQLNGTALATTYVSPTSLTATVPASDLTTVQADSITVLTPGEPVSSAVQFNVIAPSAQATFTGPATAQPGSQPSLNFQFSTPYPVAVTATFTLSTQAATSGGLTDPAVQFASGGATYSVSIPANSSTPVPVQLQTGTLAGTITVTATLSAGGVDITPSTLAPVVIQVPSSPPVLTSITLVRSGTTLTVTVQGFSSTREVQSAAFHFTSASGSTLANPDVTVPLNSAFLSWYAQSLSDQFGSAFTYVQTFNLSQDASTIGSVSVTLTNNVGASNTESAQ